MNTSENDSMKSGDVASKLRLTRKGQLHYDPDWSPCSGHYISEQDNDLLRISPVLLEKQRAYLMVTPSESSPSPEIDGSISISSQSDTECTSTDYVSKRHSITNLNIIPDDTCDLAKWKGELLKREDILSSFSHRDFPVLTDLREGIGQDLRQLASSINASSLEKLSLRKQHFAKFIDQIVDDKRSDYITIKEESSFEVAKDLLEMQNLLLQHEEKGQEESEKRKMIHEAHFRTSQKKLHEIMSMKRKLEEKKRFMEEQKRLAEEEKRMEDEKERKRKEDEEKRILEAARNLENIGEKAKKFATFIFDSFKLCKHKSHLPQQTQQISELARNEFMKCITIVSEGVTDKNASQIKLEEANKSVLVLEKLSEHAKLAVELAEKKGAEETAKQVTLQKAADATAQLSSSNDGQPDVSKAQKGNKSASLQDEIDMLDKGKCAGICIATASIDGYKKLKNHLQGHRQKYHGILTTTDNTRKRLRFNLKGAINTPLNAVSDQTPRHLLDKIKRLSLVLSGKTSDVSGKKVDPVADPEGLDYCKGLFAQEMVMQGAKQVASSHNSAFSFAAVSLGVWVQLPDVGELILANFYEKCPYLVPFYPVQIPGESSQSYFKRLGYEVNDDTIESTDKYLKKLSGIVRLYAALIQTPMPPQFSRLPHPHGIPFGWSFCSRILNLPPIPTVTATVVYDFLEVAGHALLKLYGSQFKKLLQVLCDDFIREIDSVTPKDERGPVMRLKSFLEKCIRSGRIEEPVGYLSGGWWTRF